MSKWPFIKWCAIPDILPECIAKNVMSISSIDRHLLIHNILKNKPNVIDFIDIKLLQCIMVAYRDTFCIYINVGTAISATLFQLNLLFQDMNNLWFDYFLTLSFIPECNRCEQSGTDPFPSVSWWAWKCFVVGCEFHRCKYGCDYNVFISDWQS